MLNIMKEKEVQLRKIFCSVEKKLEKIINEEFKEFNVKVECHEDYDKLQLKKDGDEVTFRLTTQRYDSEKKNKSSNGLYFRKLMKSECTFTEKEFKEIQERLQALYER